MRQWPLDLLTASQLASASQPHVVVLVSFSDVMYGGGGIFPESFFCVLENSREYLVPSAPYALCFYFSGL